LFWQTSINREDFVKTYLFGHNKHIKMRKTVCLGIILSIFGMVLGEMMLSSVVQAQKGKTDLSQPSRKADKYPSRTEVDGLELRSFRDSSRIQRAGSRFVRVLAGKAVLDKKTGVVWERSSDGERRNWSSAVSHCATKVVGGKKGWRIPSFAEVATLMAPNKRKVKPNFPVGHPFKKVKSYLSPRNVELAFYWLSKENADGPGGMWDLRTNDGVASTISEENDFLVWCVIGEKITAP